MSRIGKLPIPLPSGVKVEMVNGTLKVKGPMGEMSRELRKEISLEIEKDQIVVTRPGTDDTHRGLYGLTRTLVANMVQGVTEGFRKVLQIQGVGYRAAIQGKALQIAIGYSHPVHIEPLPGIEFEVVTNTRIVVKGIDKELVGQVAADIRSVRPPEPYKGKGIRYEKEVVHKKVGKAGKTGSK